MYTQNLIAAASLTLAMAVATDASANPWRGGAVAPVVYRAPAPVYRAPVYRAPVPVYRAPVVMPAPVVYQTPVVYQPPVVSQTPVVYQTPVAYPAPVYVPARPLIRPVVWHRHGFSRWHHGHRF